MTGMLFFLLGFAIGIAVVATAWRIWWKRRAGWEYVPDTITLSGDAKDSPAGMTAEMNVPEAYRLVVSVEYLGHKTILHTTDRDGKEERIEI